MWKLLAGFIAFAALALFILSRGGDIDMSGEKHDVSGGHSEPAASAASAAPAAAEPASVPASAASN